MHTNKYLEKIAEYDWNDAPRDMGVGYGVAGAASSGIGAYLGLRENNEKIQRLKSDAGYRLGLQNHLDEVNDIVAHNKKMTKLLPIILASSGAIVGGAGYMAGRSLRDRALQKSASYMSKDDPERDRKALGLGYGVAGLAIGAGPMAGAEVIAHIDNLQLQKNMALGQIPHQIKTLSEATIPALEAQHAAAAQEAANGPTWRKAQRFLDHDVYKARAALEEAHAQRAALEEGLAKKVSSSDFKNLEANLQKATSKTYRAKVGAIKGLKWGLPAFIGGSGVGMVTDAWRGDFNKKASEISHEDVAAHTLLNKITNPISWAAKIDLSGNTSTRVAALALNTLAREVNHQ